MCVHQDQRHRYQGAPGAGIDRGARADTASWEREPDHTVAQAICKAGVSVEVMRAVVDASTEENNVQAGSARDRSPKTISAVPRRSGRSRPVARHVPGGQRHVVWMTIRTMPPPAAKTDAAATDAPASVASAWREWV